MLRRRPLIVSTISHLGYLMPSSDGKLTAQSCHLGLTNPALAKHPEYLCMKASMSRMLMRFVVSEANL